MLESERLLLRKVNEDDAESIFNNWANDSEVTKYITWLPHKDIEETKRILNRWIEEYNNEKTHRFGIVFKETNELIGMIDVVNYIDDCPEIGYALSRKYWNKGIMTEACNLMTNYLFNLNFPIIHIKAIKENIGSVRVIEKCGYRYTHEEKRPLSSIRPEIVTIKCFIKEKK